MAIARKLARRIKGAAERKFARVATLHQEGAPAKEIRKVSDSWIKRVMTDPKGYHKAANAKPSMCVQVAV